MDSKYIVRNSDGSIDINGSVNKFATELSAYASTELSSADIATALDSALDAHQGKRVPMQALIGAVVSSLNDDPAQFNALSKRVHAYIKGQTGVTLRTVKGVGGGVERLTATAATGT